MLLFFLQELLGENNRKKREKKEKESVGMFVLFDLNKLSFQHSVCFDL